MEIEQQGFTPEEAASERAMVERIGIISDSFIVAVNGTEEILGYVVGPVISQRYLSDELFDKTTANPTKGGFQAILSLAVEPSYRKQKVGSALLAEIKRIAIFHERIGITLTCLAELVPYYEKQGYSAEGLSNSQHAGEEWFNMVLLLK
ncbi:MULTISPECIES: GNAT family N-acetyltransferase [unclassified Enterococcus]|uniref:GNAT family N-acetyltransferase n=1 Tax=unclassified Enterococcus TaxID=2608891 RepID=UPI002474DF1C|nr:MULTISPECIES: GNAT family N-acetyltransferase [unclassified Enterococcus]